MRRKDPTKHKRAMLLEPLGTSCTPPLLRVSSERSFIAMGVADPGTVEEAFSEAWLHCIAEYKASEAFKRELFDASAADFIQSFENCKACIKYLIS